MCNPDQHGSTLSRVCAKAECPVVKSLAHAQSVAGGIETYQRYKDQVEHTRRQTRAVAQKRFVNSPAIAAQRIAVTIANEQKLIFFMRMNQWQITMLTTRQCRGEQKTRINFTLIGQIECDAFCGVKKALSGNVVVESCSSFVLLSGTELAAFVAKGFA